MYMITERYLGLSQASVMEIFAKIVKDLLFHDGGLYHIETTLLIYLASQWTGFYVTGTSVVRELKA